MQDINSVQHWSRIVQSHDGQPFVIFKHSRTCAQSLNALATVMAVAPEIESYAPLFKVVVQDNREVSDLVASYLKLKHESPQLIVVLDGEVFYEAHHHDIDPAALLSALARFKQI